MNEQRDRLRELLQAADCVPPAPDCRDTVMTGIAERKPGLKPAWVYACAAAVILAVACGGLLLRDPDQPPKRPVIAQRQPVPQPAPRKEQTVPKPRQSTERIAVKQRIEPVRRPNLVVEAPRPAAGVRDTEAPAPAVVERPEPDIAAQHAPAVGPERKPVALVLVTFPSGETTPDGSYEYTDRNAETGEVTRCSVTQTGNLIEIHLETTKGEEETPPVKGCVDHENNSNA